MPDHQYIRATLDRETRRSNKREALIEFYSACARATRRRWRTRGSCCNSLFFNRAATTSAGSAATS